ncbi:LOG family protein [Micromonosporaceae bacterium DT194]|uniref:LOG family protein n=1 Tax=Melissospora conviva TaxID=3388432 RepID=UPI003C27F215
MSTPPPADVLDLSTHHELEIETRADLDRHLAAGTLAGKTVQGLRLDLDSPDLTSVDLGDTLFVGCRFASREVAAELIRRGAFVVPPFVTLPYSTQPPQLYTADDLAAGFAEGGFDAMCDSRVYQHFRAHGGATPEVREALTQRLHDHGIDNALAGTIRAWVAEHGPESVVGVMGGHAVLRGAPAYRQTAVLGWELARAGRLVITGGGPGVMEAANLGAYLSRHPAEALQAAIDELATAPDFHEPDPYTAVALRVRQRYAPPSPDGGLPRARAANDQARTTGGPDGTTAAPRPTVGGGRGLPGSAGEAHDWARQGGLSIPTWLYGHEPANLFAGRIAKYFSNAIREDTILRLARGGIVFAPGGAGTVQEVFQAATKTYYCTDGASGAYVFLGREFWTSTLPVATLLRPLLAAAPYGDLSPTVHLTDDVTEAVRLLLG